MGSGDRCDPRRRRRGDRPTPPGALQILDTGSYVSGAEALGDGHPFTTTLAPSFSNFTVIEFLDRGGRLPFVDFPVGWSSLGGVFGLIVGIRPAFVVLTVAACASLAAAIVLGPGAVRHRSTRWWRAVFAVGLTAIPVVRLVTQGVLTEPIFAAIAVGLAAALTRYRATGERLRLAIGLAATAGLIRFVGGALAILPAIEHYRRHRDPRRAVAIAAATIAPVAVNVVVAGAAGGGHTSTWHGIDGTDIKLVARSLAGMFDAGSGDLAATLLRVGALVAWWGYPLLIVWAVAVGVALAQFLGLLRRRLLPDGSELPLVCAGVLTASLLAGLASFDALATPDNRLMLPAGILSLCAIVWAIDIDGRRLAAASVVLAGWIVVAARPWDATELFTSADRLPVAESFTETDAQVIVSNDADGFFWELGISAAYLPPARMSLTDQPVDREQLYAALPCALSEHGGIVVLIAGALFGVDGEAELDALVADGRLDRQPSPDGTATVYTPTELSC